MEEERIDFVDLSHARQFASALALHSLNRKGENAYTPWSRITNDGSTEGRRGFRPHTETQSFSEHRGDLALARRTQSN